MPYKVRSPYSSAEQVRVPTPDALGARKRAARAVTPISSLRWLRIHLLLVACATLILWLICILVGTSQNTGKQLPSRCFACSAPCQAG